MVLIHGVLLHGRLDISVVSADDLWIPDQRTTREKVARAVLSNSSLNPYVTISLEHLPKPSKRILKTDTVACSDHPVWDHHQSVDVATNVSYVVVHVKSSASQDQAQSAWYPRKSLGFVRIKAEHVLWNIVDGTFPLTGLHGIHHDRVNHKNRGRIRLSITYSPVDSMMLFGQPSVPGTYFPATENCQVQLFQDAHCPHESVLPIAGSSDSLFDAHTECAISAQMSASVPPKRRRLTNYFETIYNSILHARKLIYITGWSVDTTVHLLRRKPSPNLDKPDTAPMPLGELLKHKAAEGVTVLLLVWDELFSTSNPILRMKGLMDTRDEVTRQFFRNSRVKAAVVPRLGGLTANVIKAPLVPCLFTFHEKLVVTDIPSFSSRNTDTRELVAFCGGLDLTYGRWDTPAHSLFRTLDAEHANDFHNACFDVAEPLGPREPWHDVAAMVTGPVVRDFIKCFEERWKRQGLGAGLLVDLDQATDITDGAFEHPEEKWTVQVFRSIDERSAVFDKEAGRKLETKKGRSIDRSIHHAYVHYTRAAKRFIYIEQQYFLGSSNQWLHDGHKDGTNLIPHELALKIVQGITSGNFLRVYVVIPMFPEGVASDAVIQKILYFQMRTVEMIMKKIADAINEAGLQDSHPLDFFGLFCLGNREALEIETASSASSESDSSSNSFQEPNQVPLRRRDSSLDSKKQAASRRSSGQSSLSRQKSSSLTRRFSSFRRRGPRTADEELLALTRRSPIYQHAKLFISDDEVVLTGSANLNERSMCGVRDTELAISAFQPHHRWNSDPYESDQSPKGEVARFRKRLWAEHALGHGASAFPEVFNDPGSLECMQEMQRIARRNWDDYVASKVTDLKSHLLPYPYNVDKEGNITGCLPEFPDTRGSITGTMSGVIPNILVS